MNRFTTYTDESGQVTKRKFIVVTGIVNNIDRIKFEDLLDEIEKESKKIHKWTDVGVSIRTTYTKLLLKRNIFNYCIVYFSVFNNKEDYVSLVSSQVAKSIINYANNKDYNATIFLDRVNNRMTEGIQKDIKRYKVRFKKIRALDDTNNVGLKFVDAICGLIRDIDNKQIDNSYKLIYKKLKQL